MADIKFKQTEDFQSVVWLDSMCFPSDHPLTDFEETVFWIGSFEGHPVAYCGAKPIDETCVYLSRVGVLKEFRGQGLQRRMIKLRERWAKKEGYKEIISATSRANYASSNNLIACGYKLYEPEEAWLEDGAFYFIKSLDKKPKISSIT